MNAGNETANVIVSKAQSLVKELSEIKVLDQATLNNLISKYGSLVTQYLNRFKTISVSKTEYISKASVVSQNMYQEVIKSEKDYIRETVDVYLRPVIISRQIIQDQRKIIPEAMYEEIVKPQREYVRNVIDIQLRPLIIPRIIVQDQSKTITQEAYEEIIQPLKDYVRKTVDVELRPLVVSRTIVMDKTIPRELYEFQEVIRPQKDYVRKSVDIELKHIIVSQNVIQDQGVIEKESTYEEIIQPQREETRGIVTIEPIYTPIYAIQVKNTYISEETGEPISVEKGVVPAPPGIIPPGMSWREIMTPKVEERRPEKEKVVL
jgi:hypothetical protein